jgi:uncharacterized protein YcbK (DUF882 family)
MQSDTLRNPVTGRRRVLGAMSALGLMLVSTLSLLSPAALAATVGKKATAKSTASTARKTTTKATATRSTAASKPATRASTTKATARKAPTKVRQTWKAKGEPAGPPPTTAFTEHAGPSEFDWNLSEKTVSLVTPTTGEKLVHVPYWVNGQYQPDALADISYLMRDLRTGESRWIDPALLDLLNALQATLGTREPFQIVSGYRSPETNAALRRQSRRVAAHSLHMDGKAVDIRLTGTGAGQIQRAALALGRGGVGYYPRMGFVHVDTGSVRTWRG